MNFGDVKEIIEISDKRVRQVNTRLHRSLYSSIDWSNRLISVKGPRGVGKTTMLIQRIREAFPDREKALYVSLDNLWFLTHSLRDLVNYHVDHGGTHLFVDEVHYLNNWQTLIKNLYDDFPELNIVYTGSSLLKIDYRQGDLSRRQVVHSLPGLSFREYLAFEGLLDYPIIPLTEILANHVRIAQEIAEKVKVLGVFDRYLTNGYYPFYREPGSGYEMRISQLVNQVLESDYPSIEDVSAATIRKARRMLRILSETPPQTLNLSALCRELETDRKMGYKMLLALERAGLLMLLSSKAESLKNMSRPDKIYCDNPNLMNALVPDSNVGTMRECFFFNQLRAAHLVTYPKEGDFLVDGKWLFEVGGEGKGFNQIKDIPDSFLAVDDTEVGRGARVPIWLFGFLY